MAGFDSATRVARVAVTCVGGTLSYDILAALRCAKDPEVCIIGLDSSPQAHGRVMCDAFHTVPSARSQPQAWVEAIRFLIATERLDALICLSDAETMALADAGCEGSALGAACSVGNIAAVPRMTDKLMLLTTLTEGGIDVGPFHAVGSWPDVEIGLSRLGYPQRKLVLKPRRSSGSRGVAILDASKPAFEPLLEGRFCGTGDVGSVKAAMSEAGLTPEQTLLVPHFEGPVYDVDALVESGKLLQCSTRLRQLRNPLSPTSTGHKIVREDRVIQVIARAVNVLGIDGAGDFDVILEGGHTPRIIDAGARFSGSVGGSVVAGANFPVQLVRKMLGLPLLPEQIRDGVVVRPFLTLAEIPAHREDDYL